MAARPQNDIRERLRDVTEEALNALVVVEDLGDVLDAPFQPVTKLALLRWTLDGMTADQWAAECPADEYDAATGFALDRHWLFSGEGEL